LEVLSGEGSLVAVYHRRLPVYLLVDCSESLAGEPINAIAQGISALLSDLRGDPMALETVHLAVITFASKAQFASPLTELFKFQAPKLKMGSGTSLGAALRLFIACLDRDIVKSSPTQKGDWKPICIILTDGEPTDDWQPMADKIRTEICGKRANVIAIACGEDAGVKKLQRITETVIKAVDLQPGTLRTLFRWVSSSVSTASQRLDAAGTGNALALPPLPEGKLEVASASGGGRAPDPDRYLFLHARCVKSKQFYIMRFEKKGKMFEAVATHQVDEFDFGDSGDEGTPKVAADKLGAPPQCAYCENPAISFCECGKLFCSPMLTKTFTLKCPWCAKQATYAPSNQFDVGRGRG